MTATATKRSEVVLNKELEEFYAKCWHAAKESLERLGIDANALDRIKDPKESIKIWRGAVDPNTTKELLGLMGKANKAFAKEHNLPEKTVNDKRLVDFFSTYMKTFGKDVNVSITKVTGTMTDGVNHIIFREGNLVLESFVGIAHEMAHLDTPFAKKLAEVQAMSSLMIKSPKTRGEADVVDYYVQLTGAPKDLVSNAFEIQITAHKSFDTSIFLIDLYEMGVYKPADKRIRENLEFSRFYSDPKMRRAFHRYVEGQAICAEAAAVDSSDDAVRAYGAMQFILNMTFLTPRFVAIFGGETAARDARKSEGFRDYYTIREDIGEGNLKKLDKACAEKDFVPGIDINGRLVVIDTKKLKMHEVDVEKLKAGITNIEELIGKAPKLPEKMG